VAGVLDVTREGPAARRLGAAPGEGGTLLARRKHHGPFWKKKGHDRIPATSLITLVPMVPAILRNRACIPPIT
jgi:hypothetical protein